jgi:MoxR-like ATPase
VEESFFVLARDLGQLQGDARSWRERLALFGERH